MSLEVYRVLHIVGVLLLFSGLAALWGVYASTPASSHKNIPWRAGLGAFHGLGLVILLVSGFGMLARLGLLASLPLWTYGKIAIWLILGGGVAFAKRKSGWGLKLLLAWVALGGLAAYLCVYKPG